MKATLEFNLPEDKDSHWLALNGSRLYCALMDFDNYLRNKIKYEVTNPTTLEAFEEIREFLNSQCEDLFYKID